MNKTTSQKIKEVQEGGEAAIKNFISSLVYILNALGTKCEKDAEFESLRDKIFLARTESPQVLLTIIGPYLWKYREKIAQDKFDDFLNMSFEEEISEAAQKEGRLPEDSKYEKCSQLITRAKNTWHLFTPIEQNVLKGKIKELLKQYTTFLGMSRKLQELQGNAGR